MEKIKRSWKKIIIVVIAIVSILLALLFGIPNIFPPTPTATGSFVATTTYNNAIIYPHQCKTFPAEGRYWAFFVQAGNMTFSSSTDGSSWSFPTWIRPISSGLYFGLYFDGVYLHYACYYSTNYYLYYRRGDPNPDGTITWNPEQIVYAGNSTDHYRFTGIAVDSNGYAWIGGMKYVTATTFYPVVFKNALNNGSWSTATGFPYQLSTTATYWEVQPVALTNGKVYVIYTTGGATYGRLYDNGWGAEESGFLGYSLNARDSFCPVADGDDIHLVYLRSTTYQILYNKRSYTSGWLDTDVLVQDSVETYSSPALTLDPLTHNLYVFWALTSTNYVYYKRCINGVWDSTATAWLDETTDLITAYRGRWNAFDRASNGKIGIIYSTKTASPYYLKYGVLQISYPPENKICQSTPKFVSSSYGWTNVTVSATPITALKTVDIQVNTSNNLQSFTLRCNCSANIFSKLVDPYGIVALSPDSVREVINSTHYKVAFKYKFIGAPGNCTVKVTSTDSSGNSDVDIYFQNFELLALFVGSTSMLAGSSSTFFCYWSTSATYYNFSYHDGTSWQNVTMQSIVNGWSNQTVTLPSSVGTKIQWKFDAKFDTFWLSTDLMVFYTKSASGKTLEDSGNCYYYGNSLFVDSFNGIEQDWETSQGVYPYLADNDKFIRRAAGAILYQNMSWFGFGWVEQDFERVFLRLEGKQGSTTSTPLKVWLFDGTSIHDLGVYYFYTVNAYSYLNINVTSYLNTKEKIVRAMLKVETLTSASINLRRAYLEVWNSPYPSIINLSPAVKQKPFDISMKWVTAKTLVNYELNHNASGNWLSSNITGSLTGSSAWINYSIPVPKTCELLAWRLWVRDSSNKVTEYNSTIYTIHSTWNASYYQKIVTNQHDLALRHTWWRRCFIQGDVIGFVTYNGSFLYYYSYDGGLTWNFGGEVLHAVSNLGTFNLVYENFTGQPRIHYTHSEEVVGGKQYYGCAIVNTNGSLSWITKDQVIYQNSSVLPWGIISVNETGYPVILLELDYPDRNWDWETFVYQSVTNNGTFICPNPVSIRYSNVSLPKNQVYQMCDFILLKGNEQLIIWTISNETDRAWWVRVVANVWNGTALGPEENVTSTHVAISYKGWHAAGRFTTRDFDGNIYFTYLQDDDYDGPLPSIIRYCFRNYTLGSWTIQDEFVSDKTSTKFTIHYLDRGTLKGIQTPTVPQVGYSYTRKRVFMNWLDDLAAYVAEREITGTWTVNRIFLVNDPLKTPNVDPNIMTPLFADKIFFAYYTDTYHDVYGYVYHPISATYLVAGWNNFTAWVADVGKTLGQVNASLNFDGVHWTFLVLEYTNHTRYVFVYGMSYNAEVQVVSIEDRFYIYCTEAGIWRHEYP